MIPLETVRSDAMTPLASHYASRGHAMPSFEVLTAAQLPEPQRGLLDHDRDMTPTLSAHHGTSLTLQVLACRLADTAVERTVVLVKTSDGDPVEFGAIRIETASLSEAVRRDVRAGREPLGALLGTHRIVHGSQPRAFFRVVADTLIVEALKCEPGVVLYGRQNMLCDAANETLASVLEILPPMNG